MLTQNEIARQAFVAADKPAKIAHVPLWVKDSAIWLAKIFTSVKSYGPIEFFMTVLSMEMVAPTHGQHTLKEYFETV